MIKKILIGLGVFAIILVGAFFYLNNRNRTLSPPGKAELTAGNLSVAITYSRPSVRGRLIFGSKEQDALQPFGVYWRLGANESTEITFNRAVQFNGQTVDAGTYRIYAIPGPEAFEIILNSELGEWGAFEPDHTLDILKTSVSVEKITPPVEQFTSSLVPADSGIDVVFEWSDTKFAIPVR